MLCFIVLTVTSWGYEPQSVYINANNINYLHKGRQGTEVSISSCDPMFVSESPAEIIRLINTICKPSQEEAILATPIDFPREDKGK